MSSTNFHGGEYSAARDINISITNVSKAIHEDKIVSDWFSRLNFWTTYQDTLGRRYQGTGSWFLQHEKFVKWQQAGHRTLLCTGIPGCGKSVLSAIAIEHLLKSRVRDETIAIGCVYCNYKDRQTAVNLLSSLAKQFLQQASTPPDRIKTIFEDHNGRQTQPALNEYHEILQSILDQFSKAYLVIDALDECDKNEVKSLIRLLAKVSGVRLLIFSRDIPYISHHFSDCPRLEIQANENDLKCYLDARIQEEFELSELVQDDTPLYDKIRATIVDKSCGMFLLAHLHLESLCEHDTRGAIYSALDTLPTELYVSYGEAMKRIEKQSKSDCLRAKQVLLWISCALRPLKVEELREALAIQAGSTKLDKDALPIATRLISICAGLVRVDQTSQVIKLAHETMQRYFELNRLDLFPDADKTIATASLTYLSFDTIKADFCYTDQELEDLLNSNHFLDYASRYWGSHTQGDLEKDFIDLSLKFLQNDLKVSSSSQVMLVDIQKLSGFSHRVPRKVTGFHLAVQFNLACTLDALLKVQPNPDLKDSNGRTPLSWAANLGNVEITRLLMNHAGVKVNSEDCHQQTPLSRAAEEGCETIVKLLVQHKDIIIDCRDGFGMTPLAWAVNGGHTAIIQILLDVGANIDEADDDGETIFSKAVEKKDTSVIRLLLRAGVQMPKDDNSEILVLDWAAENRHWDILILLKERGVNLDRRIAPAKTVLTKAISNGHRDTVEFLVKHGVMINAKKAHDPGPLWTAITNGQHGMLEMLLELEADANVKDQGGRTLLHWAVENDREDLLPVLVAYGASIDEMNESGHTALWTAMELDRTECFPLLLRLGANIDIRDGEGITLLHRAVALGRLHLVRIITECGANIEAEDAQGQTSLRHAVNGGQSELVRILVTLGANINTKDSDGMTIFRHAVLTDPKMMRLLVQLGYNIHDRDENKNTALHYAVENNRAESAGVLLSLGANIKARNSLGWTALHLAVQKSNKEVVQIIASRLCDLGNEDYIVQISQWNDTYLCSTKIAEVLFQAVTDEGKRNAMAQNLYLHAIKRQYRSLLGLLFEHRYKFKLLSPSRRWLSPALHELDLRWFVDELIRTEVAGIGEIFELDTPLHIAAQLGQLDMIDKLLRSGCLKANAKSSDGLGPIHIATQNGDLNIVKRLLDEDCVNVNDQTDQGMTPLHIAAQNGDLKMLKYLLLQDESLADIRTNEGLTPLHLAAQRGRLSEMKKLLQEKRFSTNVKSNDGRTPAQLARDQGHIEVAEMLCGQEDVERQDLSQYKTLIRIKFDTDDERSGASTAEEWRRFFDAGANLSSLHGFTSDQG